MSQEKFSIGKRVKSFKYAFNGISILLKEEHNSRIHLLATVIIVSTAFYFNIAMYEWLILTLTIGLVFICEIFNTAIENISDFVSPDRHQAIKRIKDLAAAAVLFSSIIAVIIGTIIFLPKMI